MLQLRFTLALGALGGSLAVAQPPGPPHHGGDFEYMHARMGMQKTVTGSPYTAQAVSQFTQTLADGSHIQRSTNSSIARDSAGRVRREESVGALTGATEAPKAIFIHDPVGGSSYVLDPASKIARVSQPRNFRIGENAEGPNSVHQRVEHSRSAAEVKTEDLGTQNMEGLTVTGKRFTRTIAAGQIGNEHQLQIVTEVWYSPDLQTTVMSTTNDPRTGVSTYKLTNVSRAEPDASLFQVPADYKVEQGGGHIRSHQ
ncbi:MAG TPA: hypothetical protein VKT81_22755 [Bryobacteraceae bacterium]|nr:hypothetical protein [Bryobacteraceae bacterium]